MGASLDILEIARANSSRSRNLRLTAIRSFFRYTALECPEHSAAIQRVLAIPPKRQSSRLVDFLTRPEIDPLGRAGSNDLAGQTRSGLAIGQVRLLAQVAAVLLEQCLARGRNCFDGAPGRDALFAQEIE